MAEEVNTPFLLPELLLLPARLVPPLPPLFFETCGSLPFLPAPVSLLELPLLRTLLLSLEVVETSPCFAA